MLILIFLKYGLGPALPLSSSKLAPLCSNLTQVLPPPRNTSSLPSSTPQNRTRLSTFKSWLSVRPLARYFTSSKS